MPGDAIKRPGVFIMDLSPDKAAPEGRLIFSGCYSIL
ncbi:Uncharacterised protein [Mycobacteroides abscessus subsp. abscessus]|nr:Uncharacterised protein [Mycobacteroides abscessus subsp. abscessus]